MQQSIGIFGSPEEQQRQWEDCRRGVIPESPSMGMQIPLATDPSLAPPGKHAASVYAFSFPVEADREHHGRLKNEMAQRSSTRSPGSRRTSRTSRSGTSPSRRSTCRPCSPRPTGLFFGIAGAGEGQSDEHVGRGDEQPEPVRPFHGRIWLCRKVNGQEYGSNTAQHEHHQLDAGVAPERRHRSPISGLGPVQHRLCPPNEVRQSRHCDNVAVRRAR
jgi:hypothetical protein